MQAIALSKPGFLSDFDTVIHVPKGILMFAVKGLKGFPQTI
jgi:hypothetical protein